MIESLLSARPARSWPHERGYSGCDDAGALEKFQDGFLTLVGHGALQAVDFAKHINALAVILIDADLGGRHFRKLGELLGDFVQTLSFDARPAEHAQVHTAIDANR